MVTAIFAALLFAGQIQVPPATEGEIGVKVKRLLQDSQNAFDNPKMLGVFMDRFEQALDSKVPPWWKNAILGNPYLKGPVEIVNKFAFHEDRAGYVLRIRESESKSVEYTLLPQRPLIDPESAHVFSFEKFILIMDTGATPIRCILLDYGNGKILWEETISCIPGYSGKDLKHQIQALNSDDNLTVFGKAGNFFYGFAIKSHDGELLWELGFFRPTNTDLPLFRTTGQPQDELNRVYGGGGAASSKGKDD